MSEDKSFGVPEPDSDVVNNEPTVLLIGYGWVGQYCGKYFKNADYVQSDSIIRSVATGKVVEDIARYDLAIISVPTPMDKETGQCDVSIVEEVVAKYRHTVDYFLIKSTVEIGTTDRLAKQYNVKIAMSPEYIGETLGHPMLEPKRDAFQIIGGEKEVASTIARFWEKVLHASAPIMLCTSIEAEIIKYAENMWIMQRVDYWNDVFDICEVFNGTFENVREGLVLDPRFSRTHSNVYVDNRGWSGKCLPKDMNGLAYSMRKAGSKLETVEHQIEKNGIRRSTYDNSVTLIPSRPLWGKEEER